VLLARSATDARIIADGTTEETIGLEELRQRYIGTAILARANYPSMNGPRNWDSSPHGTGSGARWRSTCRSYRDVMLAAADGQPVRAGPASLHQDRLRPRVSNRALETLWMLAAGIVLVFVADSPCADARLLPGSGEQGASTSISRV